MEKKRSELRILLIEDDEDDFLLTRELFDEMSGVRVKLDWESAYEDGLRRIEAGEHDLYLIDYRLGGHDGLELIREARRKGVHRPMIVLTGQGGREIDEQAMQAGAADYLVKGEIGAPLMERSIRYALERQRTMDALLESEERYALAVSGANDGIWDWNLKTGSVYYSPRWKSVLGYGPAEVGESPEDWFSKVHRDDLPELRRRMDQHLRGESDHFAYRHQMVQKDDATIWVLVRGNAIRDEKGSATRLAGTLTDITETKQAEDALFNSEEQLRHSQKMEAVGRLAGGVAHDFNNLLTAIIANSDLVLARLGEEHSIADEVEEIRKAGNRAAALTRQLLAFSRKQVLQPEILSFTSLVMDMKKMLRRLISEDIELLTVTDEDLGYAKADPGQIEQVLLNLVVNSRDAMPEGGRLVIETCNVELDHTCMSGRDVRPGSYVMLAVSDTGYGMDADTQERVFEPFFTTKEVGKGTGLGLSTVYGIVRQSEGYVWVYSEPGQGTTFKVYLPRVTQTGEPDQDGSGRAEPPPGAETVLLVEDEEGVRSVMAKGLRAYGYHVLEAVNGRDALQHVDQAAVKIDAVVTDLVMPEMNGHELMEHLMKTSPDTHVICVSGYTEHFLLHHGILKHYDDFIPKPFTLFTLISRLRKALDGSSRESAVGDTTPA